MFMGQNVLGASKILVVVSAANELQLGNGKKHATGFFLGELIEPLEALIEANLDFDLATPNGIVPTVDRDSERWIYWKFNSSGLKKAKEFVSRDKRLKQPIPIESLSEENLKNYVGLFVPGGHGPMVDLFDHPDMAKLLMHFHSEGKPIGLICHAPVVLLSLANIKPWPYRNYSMTVFSNTEEKIAEKLFLGGTVPFYPQTELETLGAKIRTSVVPSLSHVQRDRELVTGQNPSSPRDFGAEFVRAIQDYLLNGRLN